MGVLLQKELVTSQKSEITETLFWRSKINFNSKQYLIFNLHNWFPNNVRHIKNKNGSFNITFVIWKSSWDYNAEMNWGIDQSSEHITWLENLIFLNILKQTLQVCLDKVNYQVFQSVTNDAKMPWLKQCVAHCPAPLKNIEAIMVFLHQDIQHWKICIKFSKMWAADLSFFEWKIIHFKYDSQCKFHI